MYNPGVIIMSIFQMRKLWLTILEQQGNTVVTSIDLDTE